MSVRYGLFAGCVTVSLAVGGPVFGQDTSPLVGVWKLTQILGNPAVPDVLATIEIGQDGKLTGSGGCNRFVGSIAIKGDSVQVSQVVSTRMLCLDPVQAQEDALLRSLETITTADVGDDGRLTMRNDREIILEATALSEPPK